MLRSPPALLVWTVTASLFATGALAQSPLESTFAGGFTVIAQPQPITALFDVAVVEPQGIVVTQFDLNANTNHGTDGQLGVWITAAGGTHDGNQEVAAAWTLVSTATRSHAGGRTEFVLDDPFVLAAGSYGVALHCVGINPVYTNGTTQVPPFPDTYGNAEATLDFTAGRMRTSNVLDPFGPGTGDSFSPRQVNLAMHYVVGDTYVDFRSDRQGGGTPLDVQFTSQAVSGAPGGIVAYAWDFDGDSNIDATGPAPSHTYTTCGSYTVSLSIVDATGATTETKTDYIVTDIVQPSFDNVLVAPGQVQFLDTSTPTPTSWQWDLDGDGITDSTVQNPTFHYGVGCGEVTVSLTVSRACQPPVSLTRTIAVASTIETTFAGGFTVSAPVSAANYFDVRVLNPLGITLCGMHVHSELGGGTPLTVNLYQTDGSYVGKTDDIAAWRLIASDTVMSVGAGARTFVPFSLPVHLANGDFGICMEHVGDSPVYSNVGGPLVVDNGDLVLTTGASQAGPIFTDSSLLLAPRAVNIALHYSTSGATGAAGYGFVAPGCPGSLGVPGNTATTLPSLGGQASIVVDKLPFGLGVMALGLTRLDPALDLGILGMNGCALHHSGDAAVTLSGAGNTANLSYPIPNTANLVGVQVYLQAFSFDPGVNSFDFAISDAAVMLIGN